MSANSRTHDNKERNPNVIFIACILFNLSIGVLYSWSVLATNMVLPNYEGGFGWTATQAGIPFTVASIAFAIGLLIGGRIQDKIGPRLVVTTGALCIGLGLILAGFMGNSLIGITLSFGVLSGLGMGFGYGCATPPALKWFHPSRKGFVSGLIVGGFGLSSMGYAPLTTALLNNFTIERTFTILGIGIIVISTAIAQLINNPPTGYTPIIPAKVKAATGATTVTRSADVPWNEMIKTKRFILIFIMFLLSSSVGLMVIGAMSNIAESQVGITEAGTLAFLVSFLALTNTLGRVAGGMMSDKIGRVNALYVIFILQAINLVAFLFYQNLPTLMIGIVIVGFCYGTTLSVMPVICADQYGLKGFGLNYGILFLAWGLSGIMAPVLGNTIYDTTGSFDTAFIICAVLMVCMVFATFLLKRDIHSRQGV